MKSRNMVKRLKNERKANTRSKLRKVSTTIHRSLAKRATFFSNCMIDGKPAKMYIMSNKI